MKTNVVDVSGMLSPLSARGVEKQLSRLHGVKKVEVNYVAGSATVTYDEAQTDLKTIKAKIEECGYHCGGELVPRHVCAPEDPPQRRRRSRQVTWPTWRELSGLTQNHQIH